ncbi:hypothetical protein HHK36_000046 [Tetracentron sinense]|uniref:Uncharacterized protein n=1 Tax=Tetracentron sinense TaxID=13715 RepID=A0A834ZTF2_TETSI|nr:hypothetical protein HHK36_000046 [Tetracentron sinense]
MLETVKYLIGSIGASGFGSKSTAEQVTEACPDLRCITAIITGATSGIGAETARVLAKRGARLVLPSRSLKAGEEAKSRIVTEFPDSEIVVMALDLSSLSSVRSFVSEFESLDLPINLLINNAGKFSHEHEMSEDGIEMTFATNYLGHFLLTKLLIKKMIETANVTGVQGRIVNVSSSIHGWFFGDGIRYLELIASKNSPYNATRAYSLSKLANVLHTKELAEILKVGKPKEKNENGGERDCKLRASRDRENETHQRSRRARYRSGVLLSLEAIEIDSSATHPRLLGVSGKYFADCNEASTSKLGSNMIEASRLWSASEAMTAAERYKPSI